MEVFNWSRCSTGVGVHPIEVFIICRRPAYGGV